MKTYQQIQKKIVALEQQAEKAKTKEVAGMVASIKEAIKFYGLTAHDLGPGSSRRATAPRRVAATGKRARAIASAST